MSTETTLSPPPPQVPASPKRQTLTTVLLVAVVLLAALGGYLSYQLYQTNNQLQHRIDLTDHFTETCTGAISADGLVFTETCTDNYGDICTFTETFASASNPTVVSSTTACRPAS